MSSSRLVVGLLRKHGKRKESSVIEVLEIKDNQQIKIRKWSLSHLDKVWARTSDTISGHPSDDRLGLPLASRPRRNKQRPLKAHKAKATLRTGPTRSILKSSQTMTEQRHNFTLQSQAIPEMVWKRLRQHESESPVGPRYTTAPSHPNNSTIETFQR